MVDESRARWGHRSCSVWWMKIVADGEMDVVVNDGWKQWQLGDGGGGKWWMETMAD